MKVRTYVRKRSCLRTCVRVCVRLRSLSEPFFLSFLSLPLSGAMAQGGRVVSTFEINDCVAVSRPGCAGDAAPLVVWPAPILVGDARFFLMRVTSDWICRFVTGLKGSTHPMANAGVLETIRDAWQDAETADESLHVNGKRKRPHRRVVKEQVVTLSLPRAPGRPERVEVRALRRLRDIYLELTPGTLTWLYEWCRCSNHAKRDVVRQRNSQEQSSDRRGVFFSRAHSAWFARSASGSKKFVVCATDASGAPLAFETYRILLDTKRQEAEEWLDSRSLGARAADDSENVGSACSTLSWSSGVAPSSDDLGSGGEDLPESGGAPAQVEDPF